MTAPQYCPCGFDVNSVTPTFGADWYRAHNAHHLAKWPDVDQITKDNLAMFVELAEQREREAAI